ncbi:MAG: hypothetical protein D3918_15170 [Candidatus Electrothrix sp. AX2]|nr:hypothetical protein [Candidatus Electrothrix gigas]
MGIRGREQESNDLQVATYLQKISTPAVVIGGHTHELYPRGKEQKKLSGTKDVPVVQADSKGAYLGKLTVKLQKIENKNAFFITHTENELLESGYVYHTLKKRYGYKDSVDGKLGAQIETLLNQSLQEVIGSFDKELALEFTDKDILYARYADPEEPLAEFMDNTLVNHFCRSDLQSVQEMLTCSNNSADCMLVAAFNGSGINGLGLSSVPQDDVNITYGEWYEVMPYADTIFVYKIPTREFKLLLAENAKRFQMYASMDDKTQIPEYPKKDVLHFSNNLDEISYKDDLHVDEVIFLVPGYIAAGRGGWQMYFGEQGRFTQYLTHDTQLTYRKQIIEYIRQRKHVSRAGADLNLKNAVSASCVAHEKNNM